MKQTALILMVSTIAASQTQAQVPARKNAPKLHQQSKNNFQRPPTVAAVKLSPPKAVKFSMEMIENGQIDPAYNGLKPIDVIESIEKLSGAKKGEFESTADYNARRSAELSKSFLNGSTVNDIFAFVMPVEKSAKYSTTGIAYDFDPDNGEVKLFALPKSSEYTSLNGIGAPDYEYGKLQYKGQYKGLDQFKINFRIDSRSTYQASNAYGASVLVEKTIMSNFGIASNKIAFLDFKRDLFYSNPTPVTRFHLDNAVAAVELPNMKALLVMKLSPPFIIYNYSHKEPKRDSPSDISVQEKFLAGDIIGIVYYSGKNGKIFARIPENFGVSGQSASLGDSTK